MFNVNEFNAMLARKGLTKDELAKLLGISRDSLYRKIANDGKFVRSEITKMIEIFGIEDVVRALFYNA